MHKWQLSVRALGVFIFFCGFAAQPVRAEGSVSSTRMGYGAANIEEFRHFQSVIRQYSASGERFRIDSHCQSACTMFLAIRNVCVEPSAELLFHAGGDRAKGIISPKVTQKMLSFYKPALRQYVTANHFMDTLDFHSISGSEIISRFGYPACR